MADTIRYSHPPPSAAHENNPLTTLLRRLEAATSRLEDLAASTVVEDGPKDAAARVPASASAPALSAVAAPARPPSKPAPAAVPRAIGELDEALDGDLQSFMAAASTIGGVVEQQARTVCQAAADQRTFLLVSTKAKKPDMTSPQFSDLINDLQQRMVTVNEIKEQSRDPLVKDHLAMVGEGVGGLQWLVMEGKPADFVGDILGGAQFWGNKVLKTYKDKDQTHVTYVQSYYALLRSLQTFIKEHYPSGLTWNSNGIDALEALNEIRTQSSDSTPKTNGVSSPAPAPSTAGSPPPPPPIPTFDQLNPPGPPASKSASAGGDISAVFSQLNRGASVTSTLRKVDASQMTHKNPALRARTSAPSRTSSTSSDTNNNAASLTRARSKGPSPAPKPAAMRHPPALAPQTGTTTLDGTKWLIDNHSSPPHPITLDVSRTQSILITRCTDTTIILRGKAAALSVANSPRTALVLDSLVAAADVIACPAFALQVLGQLPTVLLDRVDGATIYLSAQSLATEVFTSKCSGVNVNLPLQVEHEAGGDYRECALPEQMRSFVRGGVVVSEVVEHVG